MFKVGDILDYSWGYDQTNIEFFQVVKVLPKSVQIRKIAQKNDYDGQSMTGTTIPIKGKFVGEPITKRIRKSEHFGEAIDFDHGVGTLWNGKPQNYSDYA